MPRHGTCTMFAGLRFLGQSFRNGKTVGAVWPSGRPLVEAMVRPVLGEPPALPLRLLEVGAGVGPVTLELVSRLRPGDELDVVELNPELCALLQDRVAAAPPSRGVVRIHNADILHFEAPHRYHHVVSGLPLANFPSDLVRAIYERFFSMLDEGGTLVMFQHILGRELVRSLSNAENRARAQRVMEIEASFEALVVAQEDVLRNVPPARVVVRRRPEHAGH
jgi:phospholipid N-methyltransferase